MRRIIVSALPLFLLATPALAGDSPNKIACKTYAQAMADEWSGAELTRAEAGDPLGNGDQVLIIAAGKSYYVPSHQEGVIAKSVGQRIREHKRVYAQEFRRCMRGGNITINVDGALATD
jgi:hypothetical protein